RESADTGPEICTSETAIDRSIFRGLYLSLGDPVGNGACTVRVYYKPLVNWIWGGALFMALGGAFAVTDRRYALATRTRQQTIEGKDMEAIAAAVSPAAGVKP